MSAACTHSVRTTFSRCDPSPQYCLQLRPYTAVDLETYCRGFQRFVRVLAPEHALHLCYVHHLNVGLFAHSFLMLYIHQGR